MMKKLHGSEKQVAWAEDIRENYMRLYEEYKTLQEKKAVVGSLEIQEENRLSSLEFILTRQDIKTKQREIEKSLAIALGQVDKSLSKEEKRKRRKEAKHRLQTWINSIIEETLAQEDAKYWIEKVRVR